MRKLLVFIFSIALFHIIGFERMAEGLQHAGKTLEVSRGESPSASEAANLDSPLYQFRSGTELYETGHYSSAETYFKKAVAAEKFELKDYALLYLGKSHLKQRSWKQAEKVFRQIPTKGTSAYLKFKTQYALTEALVRQKKWKDNKKPIRYLSKNWRSTEEYPTVVWRAIQTYSGLKSKKHTCRWARVMYTKYPNHPLAYDWSVDMSKNTVDGKKLNCDVREKDIAKRVRRLQLVGEGKRAYREASEVAQLKSVKEAQYISDLLVSRAQVFEGDVFEAIHRLLKYYDKKSDDKDYLNLLGKAASRAGRSSLAYQAYDRVYEINKKSRRGQMALFKSAFAAYQAKDYGKALASFEKFRKKFPRSSFNKDAQWYEAWIFYLQKDYTKAISSLETLKMKIEKSARDVRGLSEDRVKYWLAMSYLRNKDLDKANTLFSELISNPLMGYYSFAALQRVQGKSLKKHRRGQPFEEIGVTEKFNVADKQALHSLSLKHRLQSLNLVSAKGRPYMERALSLIQLGFNDWARWELYAIEQRTRNKTTLHMLASIYQQIEAYNRTSYIAQIYFGDEREKKGLSKAYGLWRQSYPQAYSSHVYSWAQKFDVPEEFVWSIMKAESRFNPNVVSPVGAQGLMQIMPYTAARLTKLIENDAFNLAQLGTPKVNIALGTRYLQRLLKKFDGVMPLAAASYNAGPHRVEVWLKHFGDREMDEFIEHIPFVETRNYVKKVIRYYGIYHRLNTEKTLQLSWLRKPINVKISQRPELKETWDPL